MRDIDIFDNITTEKICGMLKISERGINEYLFKRNGEDVRVRMLIRMLNDVLDERLAYYDYNLEHKICGGAINVYNEHYKNVIECCDKCGMILESKDIKVRE